MSGHLDVALVVPPVDLSRSTEDPTMERLGVGYLAATLEAVGLSTRIWHCPAEGLSARETALEIAALSPALIGISVLFAHTDVPGTWALARALREAGCRAHITLGGHAATFLANDLLRSITPVDTIVRGEGEITLQDLALRLARGDEWLAVPGLSWRQNGSIVHNRPRPLVPNLDHLPFPVRDRLHWSGMVASSRGCPYRCVFCSVHPFYRQSPGKVWRGRSAANVADEVELLQKEWGLERVTFVDDNFMGPGRVGRRRALELGQELIRRKLYVEFLIDARADGIHEEVLAFLKTAGLKTVFLGIESGSQRALDFLNKRISVETNKRALATLHRLGLEVLIGFITFDPFTSPGDLQDNIRFYRETGLVENPAALSRFFGQLKVFRGTPLESILRDQDLLVGNGAEQELELGYRFLDSRTAALAEVATLVSNQPGRSYVLSGEFQRQQTRLQDRVQRATGLGEDAVGQVLAARGLLPPIVLEQWQALSLRQAFNTFANMVEDLDHPAGLPCQGPGELLETLTAQMQATLAEVDRQVLGKPFAQAVQQARSLNSCRRLSFEVRGQPYEVDLAVDWPTPLGPANNQPAEVAGGRPKPGGSGTHGERCS